MYETSKDLGMAQEKESGDQYIAGNVQEHARESYENISDTEQRTSPTVANDACLNTSSQTERAHAHERQLYADFDKALHVQKDVEGPEQHVHERYTHDVDDTGEKYEKMMEHIDDVLSYIDRSIERNTLSMTILGVTTMIGFTVLAGLMLLTWNIEPR